MSAVQHAQRLDAELAEVPVIAILRGLRTGEAVDVVEALFDAGIRVAEVPLNSPDPFVTIARLAAHFGDRMMIGGGTVVTVEQVAQLAATGATLCVSPNTDPTVIRAALASGLVPVPGFATPSEAFAARAAGARHLKMFPSAGHASDLAAIRTVLPKDTHVVAVGGVNALTCAELAAAGASSFGIGGDLYRPGMSAAAVGARARELMPWLCSALAAPVAWLLCQPQASIGEAPLWHATHGRVYWTDPLTQRLLHAAPDGACGELSIEDSVWSLAPLAQPDAPHAVDPVHAAGTTAHGFCHVDLERGTILRGPAAPLPAGVRFNDMVTDARGGLWAGAMHKGILAGTGSLYYAPKLQETPRAVAHGLGVPNGMGFSADQRTLYVIDTLARTLLAYPADTAGGTLGEPAIVTDFLGVPGKPDGMTVAADGTLWVAMWGGSAIVQIAPDGALLQSVRIPALQVSSVCEGPEGTLFASTSRMRLSPRQLADAPGAGGLFIVEGPAMD
ncbi:2-dehydro-3-deoxy-6-phosphogalactonate aldolase [Zemynaea arenosa]|uniref:2-dehydro-3-deoxy-6-phosphogalactonate aldolase n=1 Tax=Zemynaea arenosa TaxID=2561931 RepID=UPI0014318CEF|nr:2-dehydro-3-deoxy-6-phosphogalactonate aldolase [Massilia arenosa]